mmetsp:Transcript_2666/g.5365  ORF Transcript_2666/g.5365 Transcript_2666/m.5365 type:complete len:103 (+) Transcript_2666:649-957(+)
MLLDFLGLDKPPDLSNRVTILAMHRSSSQKLRSEVRGISLRPTDANSMRPTESTIFESITENPYHDSRNTSKDSAASYVSQDSAISGHPSQGGSGFHRPRNR